MPSRPPALRSRAVPKLSKTRSAGSSTTCRRGPGPLYEHSPLLVRLRPALSAPGFSLQGSSARPSAFSKPGSPAPTSDYETFEERARAGTETLLARLRAPGAVQNVHDRRQLVRKRSGPYSAIRAAMSRKGLVRARAKIVRPWGDDMSVRFGTSRTENSRVCCANIRRPGSMWRVTCDGAFSASINHSGRLGKAGAA